MIKLCIFDLDGTVMDTLASIAYYVNYTLKEMGFDEIEQEKFKYFAGNGRAVLLERSLSHINQYTEENFKKAVKIYDKAYEGNSMYLTKPFDGIIEAISKIKDSGVKIAVLSNKPDNVTKMVIEDVFGRDFFDYVQGQTDDVPMKPDPTGYIKISKEFGFSVDECIMIGDTNVDIGTGVNAKSHTLGVLWGFRTYDELSDAGAEVIVATPEEMSDYILKNNMNNN